MTDSGGFTRWFGDTFRSALDGARGDAKESFTLDGYEQGSRVALTVVDGYIEDMNKRVREGGKLTQQEVFLLTRLSDLKADIERELPYAWRTYIQPATHAQP